MALQRLYVYYRVRAHDAAAAMSAWTALRARWSEAVPGLQCELLRRADEADGSVTLMETYTDAPLDALRRVEQEAAAQTAPWLTGARHVEVFTPCA